MQSYTCMTSCMCVHARVLASAGVRLPVSGPRDHAERHGVCLRAGNHNATCPWCKKCWARKQQVLKVDCPMHNPPDAPPSSPHHAGSGDQTSMEAAAAAMPPLPDEQQVRLAAAVSATEHGQHAGVEHQQVPMPGG